MFKPRQRLVELRFLRLTDIAARGGANLLSLRFSRDEETEADQVSMELAAWAAVVLWQKMSQANMGAPPQ